MNWFFLVILLLFLTMGVADLVKLRDYSDHLILDPEKEGLTPITVAFWQFVALGLFGLIWLTSQGSWIAHGIMLGVTLWTAVRTIKFARNWPQNHYMSSWWMQAVYKRFFGKVFLAVTLAFS